MAIQIFLLFPRGFYTIELLWLRFFRNWVYIWSICHKKTSMQHAWATLDVTLTTTKLYAQYLKAKNFITIPFENRETYAHIWHSKHVMHKLCRRDVIGEGIAHVSENPSEIYDALTGNDLFNRFTNRNILRLYQEHFSIEHNLFLLSYNKKRAFIFIILAASEFLYILSSYKCSIKYHSSYIIRCFTSTWSNCMQIKKKLHNIAKSLKSTEHNVCYCFA